MNIKSVKSINPFKSVIQTIYDFITKGHGGKLKAESSLNRGSTFIIILPN